MNISTFRLGRLLTIVILFLALCFLFTFKDSARNSIKVVLESNWTPAIIWILALTGVVADKLFAETNDNASGSMYSNFGKYADSIFSIATFGFAGSTSIALLKGLYLQAVFDVTNFIGFGNFDLASIFVISSFLLFYSVNSTLRLLRNVLFQAEAEQVTVEQSA